MRNSLSDKPRSIRQLSLFALIIWSLFCTLPIAVAQQEQTALTRADFAAELGRLEKICERLELTKEGEICRRWLAPSRTDHHRLYLPADFPAETGKKEVDSWRNHFVNARKRYAEHLYSSAKIAAEQGKEVEAYRLVWQTLRENPEHAEAKRVLGKLATSLAARPQQRNGVKVNELNLLGNINRWQSPNFQLYTRASAKASLAMVQQLEQFYVLWTQCFYELWAPAGVLKDRIAGGERAWPDSDRMNVVLLGSRDEYLKLLGTSEENIGLSVGYYNPTIKMSIFYTADDLTETLNHELTHQLFSEASDLPPSPLIEKVEGAWCIEGIALYMESLTSTDEGFTVGGLDARRLQTARYRALRDEYWPLWDDWCRGSLLNWKASTEVALMYSHAVGLTHLFFDILPERAEARSVFINYIRSVYVGKQSPDKLFEILGGSEQKAQLNYRKWMTITDEQLKSLVESPEQVRNLVLSRSQLSDWSLLAKLTRLKWLDVSFSNITNDQTAWITELTELQRLSFEATKLDSSVMPSVAKLRKLNELDVSMCTVDDAGLASLVSNSNIETLWLTGTKITTKSLPTLSTMTKLKSCDVNQTVITKEQWQEFVSKHPRLSKK